MPDPVSTKEIIIRARALERLNARRRRLVAALRDLDFKAREQQRFLKALTIEEAVRVYEPLPGDEVPS